MPDEIPVCILCEKKGRPFDPFSMMVIRGPGERLINVPIHLACLIQTIAGECAKGVRDYIRDGEISVGLDEDDEDIQNTVAKIAERLANKYL